MSSSSTDSNTRPRPRSIRKWIVVAAALILAIAGYFFWRPRSGESTQQGQPPQRPPVVVAAAYAEQEVWQTRLSAVGTLEAVRGVEVTTEAAGLVSAIHFKSGDHVRRGELIVQLNDEPDRKRLASLVAQMEQARSELARNRQLAREGILARVEAERSDTALENLQAQVAEQRAVIAKKRIEAPFDGELGIRLVNLGQLVQPGQPIVTLQAIAPILVNFSLPEGHYRELARGQALEVRTDAYSDRAFAGAVSAINPQVNEQTRNFLVQGRLPNEERLLRPGMFATVTVTLPDQRQVVTVPDTAVSYSPSGDAVFVVRQNKSAANGPGEKPNGNGSGRDRPPRNAPNLIVTRMIVKTGERRGGKIAILEGVDPGDQVVTAGQLKLSEGAPVIISSPDAVEAAPNQALKR